jgi:hypothetical protein
MKKQIKLNDFEPYLYNLGFSKLSTKYNTANQKDEEFMKNKSVEKKKLWNMYPNAWLFESIFGWDFEWDFEDGLTTIRNNNNFLTNLQPYLEQLLSLTDEEISLVPGGRPGCYQYTYPDDIQEYCKILESNGAINLYLHQERLFYEKVYFEVYKNRKRFKPELFKYLNMFVEELKVK